MANVLKIGLSYARPIPGSINPVLYRFGTGINLVEEIGEFLPFNSNGAVTVHPHPPPGQPWTYVFGVSAAGGDLIAVKVGLDGEEVLSLTFALTGTIQQSRTIPFREGQMTVSVGTAAAF